MTQNVWRILEVGVKNKKFDGEISVFKYFGV